MALFAEGPKGRKSLARWKPEPLDPWTLGPSGPLAIMRTNALVGVALAMVLGTAVPSGSKAQSAPSARKKPLRQPQPPPYQVGKASWYGERFHGRLTANGEQFDMFALTAAHRRLPLGSLVRVTDLVTRHSVVVRVNDRGPWNHGSIVDLSYAAAKALGMVKRGVSPVRLDVVRDQDQARSLPAANLVALADFHQ